MTANIVVAHRSHVRTGKQPSEVNTATCVELVLVAHSADDANLYSLFIFNTSRERRLRAIDVERSAAHRLRPPWLQLERRRHTQIDVA